MPIYEFYCPDCHMIFNFFSLKINTTKIPGCPRCGRKRLERRFSVFSIRRGGMSKEEDESYDLNLDEDKLEKVIEKMGREIDNIDEENPKQVARVMKRFFEETGIKLNQGMEEALKRMEAGEDPEKIEEELGDVLENEEDIFQIKSIKSLKDLKRKLTPPAVDDKLYDL